ncbi:DnaJ domain protein [Myxozyma melibiosi]|uniref:DnaJ domain protein n=1 Tax=Myxozyma melibiosi TaxID=54550 RepID=A0ABR1EZS9_9ASCO
MRASSLRFASRTLKTVQWQSSSRLGCSRLYSAASTDQIGEGRTYYSLFPKTLKDGPPPKGPFAINNRELRREFLELQSQNHPDLARSEAEKESSDKISSEINKAYSTLSSVLHRATYLLELHGLTLAEDAGRTMPQDPELLMEVYDVLEDIEECETDDEVERIQEQVTEKIADAEKRVEQVFDTNDLENAQQAVTVLRYWVNIKDSLKEWEPGRPFRMIH